MCNNTKYEKINSKIDIENLDFSKLDMYDMYEINEGLCNLSTIANEKAMEKVLEETKYDPEECNSGEKLADKLLTYMSDKECYAYYVIGQICEELGYEFNDEKRFENIFYDCSCRREDLFLDYEDWYLNNISLFKCILRLKVAIEKYMEKVGKELGIDYNCYISEFIANIKEKLEGSILNISDSEDYIISDEDIENAVKYSDEEACGQIDELIVYVKEEIELLSKISKVLKDPNFKVLVDNFEEIEEPVLGFRAFSDYEYKCHETNDYDVKADAIFVKFTETRMEEQKEEKVKLLPEEIMTIMSTEAYKLASENEKSEIQEVLTKGKVDNKVKKIGRR